MLTHIGSPDLVLVKLVYHFTIPQLTLPW